MNYPLAASLGHQRPDLSLAGLGAGVDQAMANPLVKAGVLALAIVGGISLYQALNKKQLPRRRNGPPRKRRSRARR